LDLINRELKTLPRTYRTAWISLCLTGLVKEKPSKNSGHNPYRAQKFPRLYVSPEDENINEKSKHKIVTVG